MFRPTCACDVRQKRFSEGPPGALRRVGAPHLGQRAELFLERLQDGPVVGFVEVELAIREGRVAEERAKEGRDVVTPVRQDVTERRPSAAGYRIWDLDVDEPSIR